MPHVSPASLRSRNTRGAPSITDGLTFDEHEVGTGVTCLAFMQLPGPGGLREGMASPNMPASNAGRPSCQQLVVWLRAFGTLQHVVGIPA